jgi:predicted nucleic acid-binding protein
LIAYLDSSAILKQYLLDEPDLHDVHDIAAASKLVTTSRFSFVEVRAGLAAARRSDRLDQVGHERAVATFVRAWASYGVIDLSEGISARAGAVAETYGLRAGDAIQLASMLELDPQSEVVVVAWDARLRAAVVAAGLMVYPAGG